MMNACWRKEMCLEREDPMDEAERIGAEVDEMQTGTLGVVDIVCGTVVRDEMVVEGNE